jgi:FPC/CPF motif-containing protein YcgG
VLNARFGDSSLFDGVVRLGLRGNLTRVDAVNELRRSLAKYSKISCRKDGNTQTIGKAPEGRSGLRIKVDLVCDFADQAGNMMTENFPIEIEAVPDPSNAKAVLITGLWHSDRMVLWQPRARD